MAITGSATREGILGQAGLQVADAILTLSAQRLPIVTIGRAICGNCGEKYFWGNHTTQKQTLVGNKALGDKCFKVTHYVFQTKWG